MLGRYPAYARLIELARQLKNDAGRYLSDGYFADLLVWFHIAWFGEHVHRNDDRVKQLVARERRLYRRRPARARDHHWRSHRLDRRAISNAAATSGRVELAVSPWAHPILPLLLDFESARAALPHIGLPPIAKYPGGEARVRWHLREAMSNAQRHFGIAPSGCWPSEGGISDATLGSHRLRPDSGGQPAAAAF